MTPVDITVTVNGVSHTASVEPRLHLGDFLRHTLNLTGTHMGCEHGVCGACTVLVDGSAVRSCLMLAAQTDGSEIITIEGLAAADGSMSPLQQAFSQFHALQCGFCTPGLLTTITQLVRDYPDADEAFVRRELSGNICRCTGYTGIVKATMSILRTNRGDATEASA
jgi:aerobic-type carbon monoxide dehydrogenase small subunit (CoxS/CutS family)